MTLQLNGSPLQFAREEIGLTEVLERVGILPESRGVAVAVNGEMVPRSQWPITRLRGGDSVEIVTARQGG